MFQQLTEEYDALLRRVSNQNLTQILQLVEQDAKIIANLPEGFDVYKWKMAEIEAIKSEIQRRENLHS